MRYLILVALLIAGCSLNPDATLVDDFDQGYLKGNWYTISDISCCLQDTTLYTIGTEPTLVPDTVLPYAHPLSIRVEYQYGGHETGYLRDPREQYYDEYGVPSITYTWVDNDTKQLSDVVLTRPSGDLLYLDFGTGAILLQRWR